MKLLELIDKINRVVHSDSSFYSLLT